MVKVIISLLLSLCVQAQENTDFLEIINQFNKAPNSCDGQLTSMASEVKQWQELGYDKPTVGKMDLIYPEGRFTHEVEMTVVLFEDAGWTEEEIRKDFEKSAEMYALCGIKFKIPKFIRAKSYRKSRDDLFFFLAYEFPVYPPQGPRPIITYGRSSYQGSQAYSLNQSNCVGHLSNLCNMVYMSENSKKNQYEDLWGKNAGAVVLSHELAHLLGNCGHLENDEINILSGDLKKLKAVVTKEQCEEFRKNPVVKKI